MLIQRIQSYTQLGVNLAGIEIIFRLLERVEQLEDELAQRGEPQRRRDDETAIELLRARLRQERSEP